MRALMPFCLATLCVAKNATYDYVIAGAGTAGLLLAVILTENPDVSVIILEAGGDSRDTSNVTDPERRGTSASTIDSSRYSH